VVEPCDILRLYDFPVANLPGGQGLDVSEDPKPLMENVTT
jgi:hypothetical protein